MENLVSNTIISLGVVINWLNLLLSGVIGFKIMHAYYYIDTYWNILDILLLKWNHSIFMKRWGKKCMHKLKPCSVLESLMAICLLR